MGGRADQQPPAVPGGEPGDLAAGGCGHQRGSGLGCAERWRVFDVFFCGLGRFKCKDLGGVFGWLLGFVAPEAEKTHMCFCCLRSRTHEKLAMEV